MELRGFFTRIRMYYTSQSIGMTMEHFVYSLRDCVNLDPFTGSPYNVGFGDGVGKNINITWDKHRDRPSNISQFRN